MRVVLGAVLAMSLLSPRADAATRSIRLAPAVNSPTGSIVGPGPGAVTTVAGDLNGDRSIDVVVVDPTGPGPLVLLNRGDGSFGSASAVGGASGVGAVASGDFNADGRIDLAGRDGQGVVVMLGNGDGTFRVASTVAMTSNAQQAVAVMDTNGDGPLDIVTTTTPGIQAALGRGDGTFALGPLTPLFGLLSDLSPAHFDKDAVVDLAVADATPLRQRVVALRGNGDGSFTMTGSGAVGYGPEGVSVGDLNGDCHDDAVSIDSFSAFNSLSPQFSVSVLLSDRHGGFAPAQTYPVGQGPVSAALGDLNGDRRLDLVVSNVGSASLTIYAGDGGGRLRLAGTPAVTGFPQTPVVVDLDGDGRPDIAVPGPGALSVLHNSGRYRVPAVPSRNCAD